MAEDTKNQDGGLAAVLQGMDVKNDQQDAEVESVKASLKAVAEAAKADIAGVGDVIKDEVKAAEDRIGVKFAESEKANAEQLAEMRKVAVQVTERLKQFSTTPRNQSEDGRPMGKNGRPLALQAVDALWNQQGRNELSATHEEFTKEDAEGAFHYIDRKLQEKGIRGNAIIDALRGSALHDRPTGFEKLQNLLGTSDGGSVMQTTISAEVWADALIESMVLARLPMEPMPSQSQQVVFFKGDAYSGVRIGLSEDNLQLTKSVPVHATLTPTSFTDARRISDDLLQDSVIDISAEYRNMMVIAQARAAENAILSGDTSTTAATATGVVSGGQNISNVSGSANDARRAWDGLRKYALTTTGQGINVNAAVGGTTNADLLTRLRGLLGPAGYMPMDHFFAVDLSLWYKLLTVELFQTIDKIVNATLITGMVPDIGRANVVVSEVMPLTAEGGGIGTTASNNTQSTALAIAPNLVKVGVRQPLAIYTMNNVGGDQTNAAPLSLQLYSKQRLGFVYKPADTTTDSRGEHVAAVGYNIDQS